MSGPGPTAGPAMVQRQPTRSHLQRGVYPNCGPGLMRPQTPCFSRSFLRFFPAAFQATPAAECPGSIPKGGELGYSLSHGVSRPCPHNPNLTVRACVQSEIGEGRDRARSATPLAHSNKFFLGVKRRPPDGAYFPCSILTLQNREFPPPRRAFPRRKIGTSSCAEIRYGRRLQTSRGHEPHHASSHGGQTLGCRSGPRDIRKIPKTEGAGAGGVNGTAAVAHESCFLGFAEGLSDRPPRSDRRCLPNRRENVSFFSVSPVSARLSISGDGTLRPPSLSFGSFCAAYRPGVSFFDSQGPRLMPTLAAPRAPRRRSSHWARQIRNAKWGETAAGP